MDATSNLSLPFIMAAQAQKHVTHNEALRALDAVVQLMVLDKDLNSPPGSPAEGARYIVAASPTGHGPAMRESRRLPGRGLGVLRPARRLAGLGRRRGCAVCVDGLRVDRIRRRWRWRLARQRGRRHHAPTRRRPRRQRPQHRLRRRHGHHRRRRQRAGHVPQDGERRKSARHHQRRHGKRAADRRRGCRYQHRSHARRQRHQATPRPPCSASTPRPTRPRSSSSPRRPASSIMPATAISTRSTRMRPATPRACCFRPPPPAAPRWEPPATTTSISRSARTARPGRKPSSSTARREPHRFR